MADNFVFSFSRDLSPEEIEARAKRRERFGEDHDGEEDGMEMESTSKRREVPHDVKVSERERDDTRRNIYYFFLSD